MDTDNRVSMPRNALVAGIVSLMSAISVGLILIAQRGDAGQTDWMPFLIWTVPFSVALMVVSIVFQAVTHRFRSFMRCTVAIAVGPVCAAGWLLCPTFILGPWIANFSFPIWIPWMVGATSGLIATVGWLSNGKGKRILTSLVLPTLLSLVVAFGTDPLLSWFLRLQEINTTFVQWQPGPGPTVIRDRLGALTELEIDELTNLGLRGELTVSRTGANGYVIENEIPSVHIIIVMQHQVDEPVRLPIPYKADVVYVQLPTGWMAVPADVPTIGRAIRLEAEQFEVGDITMFWVEGPLGSMVGSSAINWSAPDP